MPDPSPWDRSMLLLNCRICDDILALTERERRCACGQAVGRIYNGQPEVTGARVLQVNWEDYDRSRVGRAMRLLVFQDAVDLPGNPKDTSQK